jgi:osmotically-inducible protein OsmY
LPHGIGDPADAARVASADDRWADASDRKGAAMKPDAQLQADVADELFWEKRVDDREIAVSADHGTVTLRGTVGSLGAKRAATKAAQRVSGVRGVHNDLEVRLLTEHRRDDAELRGSVLKALSWNVLVPDDVDATVKDGVVTLTGKVDFRHQRDEAEATILNLRGVTEIHNEIKVTSLAMALDVSERIEKAFKRTAQIDAGDVQIEALDGTVILAGTVKSWSEHEAALEAAWAAPGVQDVKDQLELGY